MLFPKIIEIKRNLQLFYAAVGGMFKRNFHTSNIMNNCCKAYFEIIKQENIHHPYSQILVLNVYVLSPILVVTKPIFPRRSSYSVNHKIQVSK